jgi:hypothetical protein
LLIVEVKDTYHTEVNGKLRSVKRKRNWFQSVRFMNINSAIAWFESAAGYALVLAKLS